MVTKVMLKHIGFHIFFFYPNMLKKEKLFIDPFTISRQLYRISKMIAQNYVVIFEITLKKATHFPFLKASDFDQWSTTISTAFSPRVTVAWDALSFNNFSLTRSISLFVIGRSLFVITICEKACFFL